jgi:two-component system, NtrC family, response regulator AtoC
LAVNVQVMLTEKSQMELRLADSTQSYRVNPAEIPRETIIFGQTAGMRQIRERIEGVLDSDTPILIQGEIGTGKELIAKYLHAHSSRCSAPFVKMNCAAIPKKVLESELQSYDGQWSALSSKGRLGMVRMAEGGSLFLDDIGDLDREQQAWLFQMVHQRRSAQTKAQDEQNSRVRFICATNAELKGVTEGRSYSRFSAKVTDFVHVHLLPLRERKADIPELCDFFMQKLSRKFRRSGVQLTLETLALMQQWNWPGNIRELENWIARAIILGNAETIVEELSDQVAKEKASRRRNPQPRDRKTASVEGVSAEARESVLKVLQANGWSRRKAAKELHISYRSLLFQLGSSSVPNRRRSHRSMHSTPPESNERQGG